MPLRIFSLKNRGIFTVLTQLINILSVGIDSHQFNKGKHCLRFFTYNLHGKALQLHIWPCLEQIRQHASKWEFGYQGRKLASNITSNNGDGTTAEVHTLWHS